MSEYQCPACFRWAPWTDGVEAKDGDGEDQFWCQTCGSETLLDRCERRELQHRGACDVTGHGRFRLVRMADLTGISGTGVVAEGVEFSDGTVVLRWLGDWPTSVVFHDRGMESVRHIHGHNGSTVIDWLDPPEER